MQLIQTFSPLLGRVFISLIFIVAGIGKITAYSGTAGYMDSVGIPGILLPLVILTEIGGGVAVLLGFKTRLVAFLLAGFCVLSALIFHLDFNDQMQSLMFMKNIAIAGGFLFLVANGPGYYALDNRFTAR
ncbi:DoxX family protein [Marinicella sediminis]|uniref:DoxX family protein n=1 Tax=Marinicella sediminis TaxID=1792834 RepID=A0ABV7JG98_9GAMM|nr:DoxX family protein [Marinicella sediminis]